MAQIQTITISNASGTVYETAEAMLTQLDAEVDTSTSVSSLDTWSAEGTLTQGDTILSEDGTTVTITRTWADARLFVIPRPLPDLPKGSDEVPLLDHQDKTLQRGQSLAHMYNFDKATHYDSGLMYVPIFNLSVENI